MDSSKEVEIITKLGEGAYGSVYKARIIKTNQTVAIKSIKIHPDDQGTSSTTLRQLSILNSLNHQNVIKMIDTKFQYQGVNPRIDIYFQYMDQDLAKYIKRLKPIDPFIVKNIMYQLLAGVQYIHSKRVFHRDLKPQNILINSKNQVKIADFGLGRIVGRNLDTMSKQIETLWYRSPQLLFGTTRYDYTVDVWSIGCIFYQLAQGKVLFQTESEIGQIMEIMRQQGTPKINQWEQITSLQFFRPSFPKFKKIPREYNHLSKEGIDLLQRFIILNPKQRITVSNALKHKYFQRC